MWCEDVNPAPFSELWCTDGCVLTKYDQNLATSAPLLGALVLYQDNLTSFPKLGKKRAEKGTSDWRLASMGVTLWQAMVTHPSISQEGTFWNGSWASHSCVGSSTYLSICGRDAMEQTHLLVMVLLKRSQLRGQEQRRRTSDQLLSLWFETLGKWKGWVKDGWVPSLEQKVMQSFQVTPAFH